MLPFLRQPQPAGASNVISVTMTTSAATAMHKTVTVTTNDPARPATTLSLNATVRQIWTFHPASNFNLGDVQQNQTVSKTIFLQHADRKDFQVLSTRMNRPQFSVEVGERTAEGVPITVTFNAGENEGIVSDLLDIRTDDPDQPELQHRHG